MKKRKKKYVVISVIILAVIGGYYWYNKSKTDNNQVEYATTAAEKGTLSTSVSGSGNVVVDQSVNIDPTITGTVTNLSVKVGDKVEKGQLLFSIDNDQLGVDASRAYISYLQSLQSLESAKNNKKQAKIDYSNGIGVKEREVLKKKIDIAEDAIISANESVKVAQADLQNKKTNAGKRNVTALISGTVNAVNIKNGDDLSKLSSGSSRQVPMVIGDLTTLKSQVQVNEVDVSNIQLSQKAMMTFNSVAGITISGKVEKIDSLGTITQGVVNYNATIGFDTLDPRIRPGMSVSVSIITGVKQDVIIVPNSAVKTQGDGNYVEVLNSGSTPQQVEVQVGAVNNTDTEIVSGLNVGDKVITRTINSGATATATTSNSFNRQSGGAGGGLRIPGIGGGGHQD